MTLKKCIIMKVQTEKKHEYKRTIITNKTYLIKAPSHDGVFGFIKNYYN